MFLTMHVVFKYNVILPRIERLLMCFLKENVSKFSGL